MANCIVLASGNGSNFQAVADRIKQTRHKIVCLVTNKKSAYALTRAHNLGIPTHVVAYQGRTKEEAEEEILDLAEKYGAELMVLAGFMKILTGRLIDGFYGKIINIHPALLPKYPGAHAIEESYRSGDKELGITIHQVDYGVDTGPVLLQKAFTRCGTESKEKIEEQIHDLEHRWYPEVVENLLNEIDKTRRSRENQEF